MKQKNYILFALVLLLTYCSGNKIEDRFLSDLEDYSKAYSGSDWKEVTDMIYPKLFTITPKEQMIQMMSKLDSVGLKMTFKIEKLEKITEPVTSGTEKFRRIDYNSRMTITVGPSQELNIDLYKENFEATFGKENITFDSSKKQFNINAHQSMIAVSNKDTDEWKYIEFNGGKADAILTQLIPEDVLNKLKK